MDLPQLPSPKEQDPGKESAGSESTGQQRDSQPNGTEGTRIPDTDQILAMLMKLSGMVTLGMVSPAQANVIQRNLRIILDVQNQRARASNGGQSSQALADICRTNPQLLNLLEPFLDDQQMAWLMKSVQEHGNAQT
jgi:hypothetical protein